MKQTWMIAVLIATTVAAAQAQQRDNAVVSPEVHGDRRVTFRVRAPKATEASISGDWTGAPAAMQKDADGVWSVTVGPLEPGIAIYAFTVDGVAMADPVNPRVKLRARTSASLLEVPGGPADLWVPRDVPRGTVEINWQTSRAIGGEARAFYVYTPPGYDARPAERYPALYLLHGSNDTAAGWTDVGRAHVILDNLLAEGKAKPMIVVMPFGHAVPFGASRDVQSQNTAVFERYLLEDVMPAVEAKYRVEPRRERRAIVGLSMGGGQALHVGLAHLDLFAAVGAFSSAVPGDFEARFKALLDDAPGTNAKLKLLWVGCGRQDTALARSQRLSELLTARHVRHTFRETEGRHNYAVWRQYLAEVAPLLFLPPD